MSVTGRWLLPFQPGLPSLPLKVGLWAGPGRLYQGVAEAGGAGKEAQGTERVLRRGMGRVQGQGQWFPGGH
eukprot:298344-Pelagomonas_calceolata.AAC.14